MISVCFSIRAVSHDQTVILYYKYVYNLRYPSDQTKGVQYPDIALMERENEICIPVDFSVKELHRNVNCFYKLI